MLACKKRVKILLGIFKINCECYETIYPHRQSLKHPQTQEADNKPLKCTPLACQSQQHTLKLANNKNIFHFPKVNHVGLYFRFFYQNPHCSTFLITCATSPTITLNLITHACSYHITFVFNKPSQHKSNMLSMSCIFYINIIT